jgi:peptidoglycan/LPS O-acetylase OafA/YrhL
MLSKQKSKFYFPNLDASRFWAFIPVFLTHCFYSNHSNVTNSQFYLFVQNHLKLGLLGLDYFFVLSGFLITWIIIEEQKQTNNFSLQNFYLRRGLRIFPLYFLMVAIGFFFEFFLRHFSSLEINPLPGFWYFVTFTLNFYIIENGKDFLFFLVFFWSVSVEEQFYIFWSLCLKFFNKYLPHISLLMIITSVVFRYIYIKEDNYLVFHTISSLSNFACGALLAFYCFYNNTFQVKISAIPKSVITAFYIFFCICLIFYNQIFCYQSTIVFERLLFSLMFCFIIAEQVYCKQSIFKLGKSKFTDYFGKLSFGLYCYHGLIITIYIKIMGNHNLLGNLYWVVIFAPVLIFILSILTSEISYKLFEKKILYLKSKFN